MLCHGMCVEIGTCNLLRPGAYAAIDAWNMLNSSICVDQNWQSLEGKTQIGSHHFATQNHRRVEMFTSGWLILVPDFEQWRCDTLIQGLDEFSIFVDPQSVRQNVYKNNFGTICLKYCELCV